MATRPARKTAPATAPRAVPGELKDLFSYRLNRLAHVSSRIAAGLNESRYGVGPREWRSEEHTSELQSLMRISYAVFCLKKKISFIFIHLTYFFSLLFLLHFSFS